VVSFSAGLSPSASLAAGARRAVLDVLGSELRR
jgi:hypothetical protein